jgi:hypothetical protein
MLLLHKLSRSYAMPLKNKIISLLMLVSLLISLSSFAPAFASDDDKKDKEKKEKKEKKADKADADDGGKARPVLWQEPTDIESRDLFYGLGGAEGAPNPSETFKFIRRDTGGTSEKMEVEDSKGRKWTVKLGAETKSETAATRLIWAAGYHVDQDYFVKVANIDGRGGFSVKDVRFERGDDGYSKVDETPTWSWAKGNPFVGTREFQGLQTLMALINNWDLKDVNNKVKRPNKKSGGDRNTHIYYVSDLGGSLGATGSAFRNFFVFRNAPAGSKGDPEDFAGQAFIRGVKNGEVVFNYKGKNDQGLFGVKVENARWMGNLLGRLSDKQLGDAFRAGGFEAGEVDIYVRAVRKKINELKNLK